MNDNTIKDPIAYFCAEFAIDNDLPTYSGGLGILAGDLMYAAADIDMPMVGIGLLYKGKEFMQHITGDGKEEQRDSEFDHDTSFLRPVTKDGKTVLIKLNFDSYEVTAKSYQVRLSDNTIQYFLSTDVDGNPPEWISDMDALYRGDINSLIRQQILLGVGGIKLLNELDIKPKLYHINEGRPALIIWEISANLMQNEKMTFDDAWKNAKDKIIYTNHTLVAAGNITYPINVIENWATPFAKKIGVDTSLLIKDGLSDSNNFNITKFALSVSKKQSSVSKIHAEYAKKDWPSFNFIPITNGVHMPRWQDSDFRNPSITDRQIWDLHITKKRELMSTVIKRTGYGYDPEKLVVTWARRLAEYKQPKAVFADLERLTKILTDLNKPVQLLYAGNSHSGDPNSKNLIEEIIKIMSTKLTGAAIFIPNYNISLANHLTSGSDIWLNTPKGNLEACGTSGMKAISNGVLNCTVLDGWTYEADWQNTGWVLDPNNIASSFYNLLESEIAPMYYDRNSNGLPLKWIERMRKSINLASNFSAERMLKDYTQKLYT